MFFSNYQRFCVHILIFCIFYWFRNYYESRTKIFSVETFSQNLQLGRVKRIWYLSPMRAAKVQASLRIRAVSPEPPLLAHISSESRGTFKQKPRFLAPLNGWACAVKICHDGMLEDTNSLDASQLPCSMFSCNYFNISFPWEYYCKRRISLCGRNRITQIGSTFSRPHRKKY